MACPAPGAERILMRQELDETLDKLSDRLRREDRATLYLVGVYDWNPENHWGSGSANPNRSPPPAKGPASAFQCWSLRLLSVSSRRKNFAAS